MEKKMLDVKINEDQTITLPEKIAEHLKLKPGEEVRILFSEDVILLMSVGKFGEELLKKL